VLQQAFIVLQRRFASFVAHFDDVRTSAPTTMDGRLRQWRTYEGILSAAWQTWCGFSRTVLLGSYNGTVTRSGAPVPTAPGNLAPGRIAYIARCLSRNETIKANKVLAPHQEPTWGDRQLVLDCARHLNVGNVASLELGLLLVTRAPSDMRTVRNATAHISTSGLAEVRNLSSYYTGTSLRHPVDFLGWRDNQSGDIAFHIWLADLEECADYMTS
jgi:hypothetical protein